MMEQRQIIKKLVFWPILIIAMSMTIALWPINTLHAATGVPKILNYQGRLFDPSENLLGSSTGTNYCFKFAFYDDATVGGADTKLWPTGAPATMTISVTNGVFNAGVGDTSLGGDILDFDFQNTDSIFLDIAAATLVGPTCSSGDGAEVFETLNPRQRVVSSGYAINADTVDSFHAYQSASGTQIPVLTSGNLILGGINPQINATSTNGLTFQGGGGTGDIMFFGSTNKITSLGNLTMAGALTGNLLNIISTTATSTFSTGGLTIGINQLVVQQTSGNVGIGTINPRKKLHVSGGDILLDNNRNIFWRNSVDTADTSIVGLAGDTLLLRGGGGNPTLRFDNVSGVPMMTFLESGFIGLNTSIPAARFHISNGSILQDTPTTPMVIGGTALSLPGGGVMDVKIAGRYAYVIFNNAAGADILRIIDISEPTNPTVVGGSALSLPGSPRSIFVSGRYAYLTLDNGAGTDNFRIIDISNAANPSVVGGTSLSLPANGQHIFVSGRYAYLTFDNGAGNTTFRIIDIGNPSNPSITGGTNLSLPASPRQVYVSGHYAYVVFYNTVATDAFRIIDIADHLNPTIVGGSALSLGFSTWSISVQGRYAYIGFDNAAGTTVFRIVDIANPTSPIVAGGSSLSLPGFNKALTATGRYVMATYDNATSTDTFRIIDITKANDPSIVGGANLSLPSFPKAVAISGRFAYVVFFQGAGTDTFRIIDISGIEAVSLLVHSLETGSLQINNSAQIQNQLSIGGGVNIDGGGLFANGGIGVYGQAFFAPTVNATSTLTIQNATGSETLFTADTVNNKIKIGDDDVAGDPTTLLGLDTKADAGDPTGASGTMYYNLNSARFRCFENGSWKNCNNGTLTYSLLRDAAGVTMTNAAAGGTEILLNVSRQTIDLTDMSQVRAQYAHSLNSATVQLRLDFSTDSCATWNATPLVAGFGAAVGANNNQTSAFASIPTSAKADVCVRAVIIGNGTLDPIVRYVDVSVN